jgi:hypothetical protein
VTVAYKSSNGCDHPAGKAVWKITKSSSGAYTGTNSGFASDMSEGCPAQLQNTTWTLVSATRLQVCITGFSCATWTRPAPAVKAARRLSLTLFKKRFYVATAHREFCNAASGESSLVCTVKSGALVSICNRDQFHHGPLFTLDRQNRFKSAPVRPDRCFRRRFVNAGPKALSVGIYDEIHSQERLMLRVSPRA